MVTNDSNYSRKNWEIDCIPVNQTYPQEKYNIIYCNNRIGIDCE